MRAWIRSALPRPEKLAALRGLGWLAPHAGLRFANRKEKDTRHEP